MDSHLLKTSGLGKAVMLLYRHPKEVKKNRQKAGILISKSVLPSLNTCGHTCTCTYTVDY